MAATQLNLTDRIAVRRVMIDRCTAAVTKFALYVLGNQASTTEQLAWAREAIRSPGTVGDAVSWHVLDHPDYLDHGSGMDDATLQGAVETAINTRFIQPAP